jgi:biotin transport system substrate-specific component
MSQSALGAVIITFCAWLTLPFPIPFTLQTFGIFAVLFVLGGKKGFVSIALYLALGCIGVPVFSGFNAGAGALLGVTGGFLWGFLVVGALYWLLERFLNKSKVLALTVSIALQTVCYAVGTAWYMYYVGDIGFYTAILTCVVPYIVPDIIKILLSVLLANRVKPLINRD